MQVWASKWSDRAWLSRRALKLPDDDLVMGVLLQEVRGVIPSCMSCVFVVCVRACAECAWLSSAEGA